MSNEYVDRVANGTIKQLREGTAPWIRTWRPGERYLPHNPVSGHRYRAINAAWLMVQSQERGYLDTRWMTYRQAESVGAQVRRGEEKNGTTIQFWKWEDTRPLLDGSGAPRIDRQGNPQVERVQYTRPRLFTTTVFNAEQIDGLADPAYIERQPSERERHERADLILNASGVPIKHVATLHGFYDKALDQLILPHRGYFRSADEYYADALHIVGHSTGHSSRINRDLSHPLGSEHYAREELRAEIASLMMGDELGVGHGPGEHLAYVSSWIKLLQADPLEVFCAAAAAERILTHILKLGHQRTAEQEQPRSHSMARGARMDPNIVAAALNQGLEPHHLRVVVSKLETSADFGFELHRTDGISPVAVMFTPANTFIETPKRFDLTITSAEIVAWWARREAAEATLTQIPVTQVLADSRWNFKQYRGYNGGASLDEALHALGLQTVAHVVGVDEGAFWRHAMDRLSPVFGIRDFKGVNPIVFYAQCKSLADAFTTTAEQLVAENLPSAERYVLTNWKAGVHRKVSEHASLLEAVAALQTPFQALNSPSLYLKPIGDQDFDARLLAPKDWSRWETAARYRNDPIAHPIAHTDWYNDGSTLRYVSGIPELNELINARDKGDMDMLRVAASEAISRFKSVHFQIGSTTQHHPEPLTVESHSDPWDERMNTEIVRDMPNDALNLKASADYEPGIADSSMPPQSESRTDVPPPGGDRYVVSITPYHPAIEREVVNEYDSLLEAISELRKWEIVDKPQLYLKSRDAGFFSPSPSDFRLWTVRGDTTWTPLVTLSWTDDRETDQVCLSPVKELQDLANTPYGDDLEQRASAALDAIARFHRTHHHAGHVATERVDLRVPYAERNLANNAGADWDKVARTWYAPPGADLDALARWRIAPSQRVSDTIPADPRQEFADALRGAGLALDGEPEMDGVLHRARVEGDRGSQRSGAYVGYLDGHPAGFIQNYKTGLKTNWKSANTAHSLSELDRQRLQREAAERQAERLQNRKEEQEAAAGRARWLLSTSAVAPDDHSYLHVKGFSDNQHALRQDGQGNLLVPAHDIDGTVWSIQRISAAGDKMFLKGGRLDGCHMLLRGDQKELTDSDPSGLYVEQTVLIVVEGYATGRTLELITGLPVAVAFTSGNLVAVAQSYRERFPDMYIIVAGDNDHRKPLELGPDGKPKKNTGKEAAYAAAGAVGGYAFLPHFPSEHRGTDWNDFVQLHSDDEEETDRAICDGISVGLVNIDGQRIATGLHRFGVYHREGALEHSFGPELGYVLAPSLETARIKLHRGQWVATVSHAAISPSAADVFESDFITADRERADAQRIVERDRLRLADARGTGHNGESVAETLRSDEAAAQRAETPVQTRATLDMMREAAEGESEQQSVHDQSREHRRSRTR